MPISPILSNTLVWAAELGLIAIGMSLVFGILGFANFAHAEFVTVGAYLTYQLSNLMGLPLLAAIPIAMVLTGGFGVLLDLLVFSRLRNASAVSKMVASVGIAICIRAVISTVYGTRALSIGYSASPLSPILGLQFTDLQLAIIVAAVASMFAFHLVFQRTRLGKALRATANDRNLAEAKGIDTVGVIRWMWFISGTFAALGGILVGLETQLRPTLGQFILMPMFAAVTVGGLGSAYGALAGSLVLAFAQNLALSIDWGQLVGQASFVVKAGYKDALALSVLALTLLIKPAGLMGKRAK